MHMRQFGLRAVTSMIYADAGPASPGRHQPAGAAGRRRRVAASRPRAGSHSRAGMPCLVAACRSTAGRKIPFGTLDKPNLRHFGLPVQRKVME